MMLLHDATVNDYNISNGTTLMLLKVTTSFHYEITKIVKDKKLKMNVQLQFVCELMATLAKPFTWCSGSSCCFFICSIVQKHTFNGSSVIVYLFSSLFFNILHYCNEKLFKGSNVRNNLFGRKI